jgi:hypothetical protein
LLIIGAGVVGHDAALHAVEKVWSQESWSLFSQSIFVTKLVNKFKVSVWPYVHRNWYENDDYY